MPSSGERAHSYASAQRDRVRSDGRTAETARKAEITTGVLAQCDGSSHVSLGDTHCVVGIKADLGVPCASSPGCGSLQFSVEVSPCAEAPGIGGEAALAGAVADTRARESSRRDAVGVSLARSLDELFGGAPDGSGACVDLAALCVVHGKCCWILHVDVVLMSRDGAELMCCALGAKAALLDCVVPQTSVAPVEELANPDDTPDVEIDDESEGFSLTPASMPTVVSASVVNPATGCNPRDPDGDLNANTEGPSVCVCVSLSLTLSLSLSLPQFPQKQSVSHTSLAATRPRPSTQRHRERPKVPTPVCLVLSTVPPTPTTARSALCVSLCGCRCLSVRREEKTRCHVPEGRSSLLTLDTRKTSFTRTWSPQQREPRTMLCSVSLARREAEQRRQREDPQSTSALHERRRVRRQQRKANNAGGKGGGKKDADDDPQNPLDVLVRQVQQLGTATRVLACTAVMTGRCLQRANDQERRNKLARP